MKFKLVEDKLSREDMIKEIKSLGGYNYKLDLYDNDRLYKMLQVLKDKKEKQSKIKSERPEPYINLNDYTIDDNGYIIKDGIKFMSLEDMYDYYK